MTLLYLTLHQLLLEPNKIALMMCVFFLFFFFCFFFLISCRTGFFIQCLAIILLYFLYSCIVNVLYSLEPTGSEAVGADPKGGKATGEEAKKKKKKKKKGGTAERDDFLHPTSNPTGTKNVRLLVVCS